MPGEGASIEAAIGASLGILTILVVIALIMAARHCRGKCQQTDQGNRHEIVTLTPQSGEGNPSGCQPPNRSEGYKLSQSANEDGSRTSVTIDMTTNEVYGLWHSCRDPRTIQMTENACYETFRPAISSAINKERDQDKPKPVYKPVKPSQPS